VQLLQIVFAVASFAAPSGAPVFDAVFSDALSKCAALAPENRSALGNVDPEEVAFWFKSARLEASRTFWSAKGEAYLRQRLSTESRPIEQACIRQLLVEAHARGAGVP